MGMGEAEVTGATRRAWGAAGPRRHLDCTARAFPATFRPHAALRGSAPRSPLGRSPRAVSLTHGLGHLHLLVEPVAQNLRHGSACAFYGKQVQEGAGNPAKGPASSCCQRQPVAKEAYPGRSLGGRLGQEGRQSPGAEDRKPWPAPCRRVRRRRAQAPGPPRWWWRRGPGRGAERWASSGGWTEGARPGGREATARAGASRTSRKRKQES